MALDALVLRAIRNEGGQEMYVGYFAGDVSRYGLKSASLGRSRNYDWVIGFPSDDLRQYFSASRGAVLKVGFGERGLDIYPEVSSCLFLGGNHFCDISLRTIDRYTADGSGYSGTRLDFGNGPAAETQIDVSKFWNNLASLRRFQSPQGTVHVVTYASMWPENRYARISIPMKARKIKRLLNLLDANASPETLINQP